MRKLGAPNTILVIICLMYLILYVDRVNISTAAPLIKADLGLSNTQLGLAFSAFAYPYALFQLIGGYIGDKFGARLTLCVSGLIVCAATAATGAVGGLASLFVARPEFAWEHVWRVGDLVLWDNRCTMHRRDPFDDQARRVMHRTQIKGSASPA